MSVRLTVPTAFAPWFHWCPPLCLSDGAFTCLSVCWLPGCPRSTVYLSVGSPAVRVALSICLLAPRQSAQHCLSVCWLSGSPRSSPRRRRAARVRRRSGHCCSWRAPPPRRSPTGWSRSRTMTSSDPGWDTGFISTGRHAGRQAVQLREGSMSPSALKTWCGVRRWTGCRASRHPAHAAHAARPSPIALQCHARRWAAERSAASLGTQHPFLHAK
jgi:hypothetical protein